MLRKTIAAASVATILSCLGAGPGHASATAGSLWINDPNSNDASIVPAGPADATFATGAINYDSSVGGYTIGGFLNNPVFNNQSPGFVTNGGGAANLDNTFIQITGTVGLLSGNNSFVVGHDDGVVMTVSGIGTVVNQPGPTGFTNTPFNVFNPGPAGNFNFVLNYTECCGPPAVLLLTINNVNPGVPEPATWALMIAGVGLMGATLRRRREAPAAA
jgi:PEP-CTERM motif